MPLEIERKFLIDPTKWTPTAQGIRLVQAYLSIDPNPTVRVRIAGERAFLTIKGRSETISRPEFEYEIPVHHAEELMKLAVSSVIEKARHSLFFEGFLWEVDVFSGENSGLIVAEIELETETQEFPFPDWILREVSGDRRFYNSYLSEHPYCEWGNEMA